MSKRTRQIYFFCIVVLSLLALSFILLYGTGYQINLKHWRLEATGALQISTIPKDTIISVPELRRTVNAPAILQQIPPGQYQLDITAPEYLSWHGQITITPYQTTVLKNIVLWLQQPDVTLISHLPDDHSTTTTAQALKQLSAQTQQAISELALGSDYTLYDTAKGNIVLDETSGILYRLTPLGQNTAVTELDKAVIAIDWQTITEQLLVVKRYELKVYDPKNNDTWTITRQSQPFHQAWWHPLGYYALYRSHSTIAVIDSRDELQQPPITLYQGQAVTNVSSNERGNELYITDDNRYFSVRFR